MDGRLSVAMLLLTGLLFLAGCAGQKTYPTGDGGPIEPAPQVDRGPGGMIGTPEVIDDDLVSREDENNLVVYFDYDQADIRGEFNDMLSAHGRYLARNAGASLRLEGHADERGSREYNIGLGERRSQAVRRVLLLQGAAASQISTVSYGEERPAILGSDEEAFILNRRVELVYRQ